MSESETISRPDPNAALSAVESAGTAGRLSESSVANLRRWLTEPGYSRYAKPILVLIDAERFDFGLPDDFVRSLQAFRRA